MKTVRRKPTPLELRPQCVRCRAGMLRNRDAWFCPNCPATRARMCVVANERRGWQTLKSKRPVWERPCCLKCRRQMCRHTDGFICVDCRITVKERVVPKLDPANPYCLRCRVQMCKANQTPERKAFQCRGCWVTVPARSTYFGRISVLPWCLACKQGMRRHRAKEKKNDRKVDAFYCKWCKFYVAAQTTKIGLRSTFPCCLRCAFQMVAVSTSFKCEACGVFCVRQSTRYGRLRPEDFPAENPWCVPHKFPLRENVLSGKRMFGCDQCGFLIAARATRYRQKPEGWRLRRLLSLIDRHLPPTLPLDLREEASQALICDLLSGDLKQKNMNVLTARRYVRRAHVTRYADVSLDAILPSGSRLADLMAG